MSEIYVAFDTETTGFGKDDRILEIAAVKFRLDYEEEIAVFHTLINPGHAFTWSEDNIKIHGITREMASMGMPTDEALALFIAFSKGCIPVAHYAEFDDRMISQEFARCLREGSEVLKGAFVPNSFCTKIFAKGRWPRMHSYKLKALTDHFGINNEDHHRALADAIMCMEIFKLAKG